MTLEATLAALYASEIHVRISWLWDGGIDVYMGATTPNGPEERDYFATTRDISEIWALLTQQARKLYPDSAFIQQVDA